MYVIFIKFSKDKFQKYIKLKKKLNKIFCIIFFKGKKEKRKLYLGTVHTGLEYKTFLNWLEHMITHLESRPQIARIG